MKATKIKDTNLLVTLLQGESKKQVNKFYQFIEQLETRITKLIKDSGATWSTQKNLIMRSVIRDSDNKILYVEWPISMLDTIFIDSDNKEFNSSEIEHDDLVKFIVETPFLWINDNHFGLAMIVKKVMVKKHEGSTTKEYMFNEDSESSESSESDIDDPNKIDIISLLATENKTRYIKTTNNPEANVQRQLASEAKKMVDQKRSKYDLLEEISDQELSFDSHDESSKYDSANIKRLAQLCGSSDENDFNENDLEEDI